MTVQSIYDDVCRMLLEDGGLRYVYSEASFLRDLEESIDVLLQEAGICKEFSIIPFEANEGTYDLPTHVMDVQSAYADNDYLFKSSGFHFDQLDPFWESESGTPARWRQDDLPLNQIQVYPKPDEGGRVFESDGDFYGTISNFEDMVDITFTSTGAFYGTISKVLGAYYFDTDEPFYGTISDIGAADTNLLILATVIPIARGLTLSSTIPLLSDSFSSYLKYFVLEKIFSTDGESKDIQRAKYCRARVEEVIAIGKAVMKEDGLMSQKG